MKRQKEAPRRNEVSTEKSDVQKLVSTFNSYLQRKTREEHQSKRVNRRQRLSDRRQFRLDRKNVVIQAVIGFAMLGTVVATLISVLVSHQQLSELVHARTDTEAQLRALLQPINPVMFPYDATGTYIKKGDPAVAGWSVSPGWENAGLSMAKRVRYGFDLWRYPENGPESTAQLIANCPGGPSLSDHPDFPGFTIAPGHDHGIVAPGQNLPLQDAEAAQRNQMLILFVLDATYRDAFAGTPLHHAYACIGIFVNDAENGKFSFVNLKQEGD